MNNEKYCRNVFKRSDNSEHRPYHTDIVYIPPQSLANE